MPTSPCNNLIFSGAFSSSSHLSLALGLERNLDLLPLLLGLLLLGHLHLGHVFVVVVLAGLLHSSELHLSLSQQLGVSLDQFSVLLQLGGLVAPHSVLVEGPLSLEPDLLHLLHGLQSLLHEVSVVSHGHVSSGREGQGGIHHHLLASSLSERLGPSQLSGVSLHLEVLVALGSAETKLLGVVTHEHDSLTGIHWRRAEMTVVHSHFVVVRL